MMNSFNFNKTIPENIQTHTVEHQSNTPILDIIPVNGCALKVNAGSPVNCEKGILYLVPTINAIPNNIRHVV